jgi:dolichol-phosphate mannosyltransferase
MIEQVVPSYPVAPPPAMPWLDGHPPGAPAEIKQADAWSTTVTDVELDLPVLSVIVPTKNEAGNVAELARRLAQAADRLPIEVIFVDDSTDETPAVIAAIDALPNSEIVLRHRSPEERTGGLGGAVVEGMRVAKAPWVCVMDGDLQHPPELVPRMLEQAMRTNADVVVASRYREDGDAGSFTRARATVSRGAALVAHLLFPHRLRDVTDPMSGFFLVRSRALDLDALKPNGFKILLEIFARTPGLQVAEVPFQFGKRYAGESKASLKEGIRYLQLIAGLRLGASVAQFVKFGLIGVSGLFVNTFLLAMLTGGLGVFYLLSAVLATQGSTLWNFTLSERWVFGDQRRRYGKAHRAAMFFAMNNVALLLRAPLMVLLTSMLGIQYLISNLISLIVLLLLRYATADRFIWGAAPATAPASKGV